MGFWKSVNRFANKTLGKKNFSMIKRIGMKTLASALGHGIDEFASSYGGGNEKQQPEFACLLTLVSTKSHTRNRLETKLT
jgi:hypothetical protein